MFLFIPHRLGAVAHPEILGLKNKTAYRDSGNYPRYRSVFACIIHGVPVSLVPALSTGLQL